MSVIEGVGDEVLVVVGLFLLLCMVLLAWFSTHTRDIPFVSVIVVELSQRRHRNTNNGDTSRQATVEGAQEPQTEMVSSETGGEATGSNNNADTANDSGEEPASAAAYDNNMYENAAAHSVPDKQTQLSDFKLPVPSHLSDSSHQEVIEQITEAHTETAATTIPPFRPQSETGEEVRRRRVAYFGSGAGQEGSGTQRDTATVGAHKADDSVVRDSAEATASPQMPAAKSDSSCSPPSSDLPMSASEGRLSSTVLSSPVGALPSPSQLCEPLSSCSPGLPPAQCEASPPPLAASSSQGSVPEGSASVTNEAGGSPSGTIGQSSPEVTGGSEEGAQASGEERERVGNISEEMEDAGSQQIRVRLKYLNDTQRLVYADPHETIGNFRRLHFSSELEDNKIVRFIFNGQDLRNDLSTLQAYNIADNSVVHCLITQNQRSEPSAGAAGSSGGQEEDTQMGALLFPVFGVILGLVWYMRFTYKQYFNAMSTVSLAGISFIYILAFFSSVRHRQQPRQHLE